MKNTPILSIHPLRLVVDSLAPGLNGSMGLIRMNRHQYARLRNTWTNLLRAQVRSPQRLYGVNVRIERHSTGPRMDIDNLYTTSKIPLDALRHAGIIADDDPEAVPGLEVVQCKVKERHNQKTIIFITDATRP